MGEQAGRGIGAANRTGSFLDGGLWQSQAPGGELPEQRGKRFEGKEEGAYQNAEDTVIGGNESEGGGWKKECPATVQVTHLSL